MEILLGQTAHRGAWCLSRTEADVTHFEMLTFWDDTASIQLFAGDDYTRARYYDFASDYLIEMEPTSATTISTPPPHPIHHPSSSDENPSKRR
jgi:hypothetical protein